MLEAEFERLYREMDSNHVRPLWTAERSILPIQPHSKAVLGCGNGRGYSISPAAQGTW